MGHLAPAAAGLPLRADLLRICHRSGRALRRSARRMDGFRPHPALPSLRPLRPRSGSKAGNQIGALAPEVLNKTLAEFKNPQQEPGAERRLLLVFVLTFVVLIIFQPLLKKFFPQPPAPQTQNQPVPAQPAAVSSAPTPSAPPAVTINTVTKQASTEAETVIENDLYKITFTNRGAQVKSWILKKFDNDAQYPQLDLVNSAAAQKYGYPLSLWTYDETLRNRLSSALYIPSHEGNLSAPAQITFEYADQDLVGPQDVPF